MCCIEIHTLKFVSESIHPLCRVLSPSSTTCFTLVIFSNLTAATLTLSIKHIIEHWNFAKGVCKNPIKEWLKTLM